MLLSCHEAGLPSDVENILAELSWSQVIYFMLHIHTCVTD